VQISYLDICGKCENIFDQIAHRERGEIYRLERLQIGCGWISAENDRKHKIGIYGNEETALIETATHPLSLAKANTLSPENQTLLVVIIVCLTIYKVRTNFRERFIKMYCKVISLKTNFNNYLML